MIRFPDNGRIHMDASLMGFADNMVKQDIVKTRLDLFLIGAAHAIRQEIPPMAKIKRQELMRVSSLDEDRRLLFEAVLPSYAEGLSLTPTNEERNLLDLLERTGSAGLSDLANEWRDLSIGQIRLRITRL